jgi:DNA-binding SARP family transcriptional activator
VTQAHADGSLRSALCRLRRLAGTVVDSDGNRLTLARDVSVDVRELMTCARRILDGEVHIPDDDAERIVGEAELLPGWDDDWITFERERVRQLRVHAAEEVARRLLADGRHGSAIDVALAVVKDEPFRESARRLLIEAHLGEGNRAEAVSQFLIFRRLLVEELSLQPSRELEQLALGR